MAKKKPKNEKVLIEVLRCSTHNVSALSIEDRRVTDLKCCGSWTVHERFVVPASVIIEVMKAVTR